MRERERERDRERQRQRQRQRETHSRAHMQVHGMMQKPAYVFDSRGTWDNKRLSDLGFLAYRLGKPDVFIPAGPE